MRAMMRIAMALLASAMAAAPAHADLRVIYMNVADAKQLQIEIDDNGDARIGEMGSSDYGLLLSGEFYVVSVQDKVVTVARIRDIATAIDQVMPPIFKGLFDAEGKAIPSDRVKIVRGDAGSAGGREGTVYHVSGLSDLQPDRVTDYLINTDPDLKPVGAVLEQFMNAAVVPSAPLIGGGARDLISQARSIFALGTPIDIGGRFRLNLASKANYDPRVFQLPGKPLTVEQLVASMKAAMAAKKGAPETQPDVK